MKIGIDIEKVDRFDLDKSHPFIIDIFTVEEIAYAYTKSNPAMHLCGMFCAKEAVRKTLRTPIKLREIRITHDSHGAPLAQVKDRQITVSIAHCNEYAVAQAYDEH